MANPDNFNEVIGSEPGIAYSQKSADKIDKNRRHLDNELFFDKLLKAVGLDQALQLYPPRSNADLRKLYRSIIESSSPDHHKLSLVYYILKDLHLKDRDPVTFAARMYLPSKYQIFVDGIWALDKSKYEEAVGYLTDPALVPTFPEQILYTLCKHSRDHPEVALAYYQSVMPPIISSGRTLDALFDIMCRSSLTEAYFFTHNHDQPTQRHLFERLLSHVHGSSGGQIRALRASELVGLPLDEIEERWFESFLLGDKGKQLYGAIDTVIMRRIVMGRTDEATELSLKVKDRKIDGLNWANLTGGLRES